MFWKYSGKVIFQVWFLPGAVTHWRQEYLFQLIWGHNLQAIAVIFLLGLFSFGVLGALVYLLNMGVIGAVLPLIGVMGKSPLMVVVFGILPHGIFEIPALDLCQCSHPLYWNCFGDAAIAADPG